MVRGGPVGTDVEKQHVLVTIHHVGNRLQGAAEAGDRRHGQGQHGARVVDQGDRPAAGIESGTHEFGGKTDFVHEHVFGGIAGGADEIKVFDTRTLAFERFESLVEYLTLAVERLLAAQCVGPGTRRTPGRRLLPERRIRNPPERERDDHGSPARARDARQPPGACEAHRCDPERQCPPGEHHRIDERIVAHQQQPVRQFADAQQRPGDVEPQRDRRQRNGDRGQQRWLAREPGDDQAGKQRQRHRQQRARHRTRIETAGRADLREVGTDTDQQVEQRDQQQLGWKRTPAGRRRRQQPGSAQAAPQVDAEVAQDPARNRRAELSGGGGVHGGWRLRTCVARRPANRSRGSVRRS